MQDDVTHLTRRSCSFMYFLCDWLPDLLSGDIAQPGMMRVCETKSMLINPVELQL